MTTTQLGTLDALRIAITRSPIVPTGMKASLTTMRRLRMALTLAGAHDYDGPPLGRKDGSDVEGLAAWGVPIERDDTLDTDVVELHAGGRCRRSYDLLEISREVAAA